VKTFKPINLSRNFQVYEGSTLVKEFKTVEQARAFVATQKNTYEQSIIYPSAYMGMRK